MGGSVTGWEVGPVLTMSLLSPLPLPEMEDRRRPDEHKVV